MSRATWLPSVLEAAGLRVVRVAGADTRGHDDLNPTWQVFHHTASAAGSDHPALGIVVAGRPDVPPPLCNILTARDGTHYYVSSGTANHAGKGQYFDGSTGNFRSIGWECENNGVGEPWPAAQLDAIARGQAAVCAHLGIGADRVMYHREFAPTRKIDPAGPGIPHDGNDWRARVAAAMEDDVTVEELQHELVNQDRRTTAIVTAVVEKFATELHAQEKRHNDAAQKRDAALLGALSRIEAKLP